MKTIRQAPSGAFSFKKIIPTSVPDFIVDFDLYLSDLKSGSTREERRVKTRAIRRTEAVTHLFFLESVG